MTIATRSLHRLLNFVTTQEGLADQLLAVLVAKEFPEMEVTESAWACSYYSVSAGSKSDTPQAVPFLVVPSLAILVYFGVFYILFIV